MNEHAESGLTDTEQCSYRPILGNKKTRAARGEISPLIRESDDLFLRTNSVTQPYYHHGATCAYVR